MPPVPLLAWMLRQLRHLLENPVIRSSVRALLFLLSSLRRYCSSWVHQPPPPSPSNTTTTAKPLEYYPPYQDVVCASMAAPIDPSTSTSHEQAIPGGEQLDLNDLTISSHRPPISRSVPPVSSQTVFTTESDSILPEEGIDPQIGYQHEGLQLQFDNWRPSPEWQKPPSLTMVQWTLVPVMPESIQRNRYDKNSNMCVCTLEGLFNLTFVLYTDAARKRSM
jgi:hypothetical protein